MLTALILGAVAGIVIGAVVTYVILHWKQVMGWFEKWIAKHENVDKDAIGFTIQEAIENGKYNVVQGVFNKSTNTVEDARRIEAEKLDRQTREKCFSKEKVTLFT